MVSATSPIKRFPIIKIVSGTLQMDIFANQVALINNLQQEALQLMRSQTPRWIINILLSQINVAAATLNELGIYQRSHEETVTLQRERDDAVKHLCLFIDSLLGTNTVASMTYSQDQINSAFNKSQLVLTFYNQHEQALADLQSQVSNLTTQLQSATSDRDTAIAASKQLQTSLDEAQANLSKFVSEFTDSSGSAPTPEPSPAPVPPAPDASNPPAPVPPIPLPSDSPVPPPIPPAA